MAYMRTIILAVVACLFISAHAQTPKGPEQIKFVRQGVQRLIFNEDQSLPLASLEPGKIIGLPVMHPIDHYMERKANVEVRADLIHIQSEGESRTGIWFGGFNPFATYTFDLLSCLGEGEVGFSFGDASQEEQFILTVGFEDSIVTAVSLRILSASKVVIEESIAVNLNGDEKVSGKIILQMLGSGLVLYLQDQGLPEVIGQSDFSQLIDLRAKEYMHSFQSKLYLHLHDASVTLSSIKMDLSTGVGQADIRAITYENGEALLDLGRLWYTMSIRGRALPHHIQGVFSMDPGIFDLRLEGVIVFDRNDGILRNEVASHVFYDRKEKVWRGLTTGFSAYANPEKEKKQLLAIESKRDPRFGFSIMQAVPFDMVGDIEDPHILFDEEARKWRMLSCENIQGYKAIMLESDHWDREYTRIAGPVTHNSTGTSIQWVGDQRYCFSGSKEREIFIYTYPDLEEVGVLDMDLPPWNDNSGTRVWPNVVQLPEGYPFRYVALMMDRFNYPGIQGPNWTYGALYLYHGHD